MSDPRSSYEKGREELKKLQQDEEEKARQKEQARVSRYTQRLAGAKELIHILDRNKDVFRENNLTFCLEDNGPGYYLAIYLFEIKYSDRPRMTRIFVGGGEQLFSLAPIIKTESWEEDKHDITHNMGYETKKVPLGNKAGDAANELMRLLGRQEIKLDTLWPGSDGPKCIEKSRRRWFW
jgi:hypothetical protein